MAVAAEVGRALLGGRVGGRHSTGMSFASAGLKVEVSELKKLSSELDVVRASTKSLREEMDRLAASSANAMSAAKGGATGVGAKAKNGMPTFAGGFTSPPIAPTAAPGGAVPPTPPGTPGAGGRFANFGGGGAAAVALGAIGGQVTGAVDRRIDRGADYAANLDRLNVVMQAESGRTQGQVMQQRKPLANYRLGASGITDLMSFQQQTGYTATSQMAQSVAGLRAMSGYTKTTADVMQDRQALLNPDVANRMLYMTGVNAYNFGGGMKDPMKMTQQLTQSLGLTNAALVKGAKAPGSVTRARMTDAGVPQEVQDEILSYAEQNLTFQKKGGTGMYDPSKKGDRKRMGIEGNFATQQEETERLRTAREEGFARTQLDNMAQMEKNTQAMVKLLGSIEQKLSGVLGARISNRGWMKPLGGIMQAVGAGMMLAPGVGTLGGAGLLAAGTAMAGDPVDGGGSGSGTGTSAKGSDSSRDSQISIPVGYGGKTATLDQVKQRSDFKNMNPKMKERLLSMFRANPRVGIGGGTRDTAQQEALFKSRYRRTTTKTKIHWDGSYWEHVSGAAAAPPGRSMHEIGLAADLIGDIKWMNANASRFGLKHFASVNSEPWHVQPSELPDSRRKYEEGGAQWGTDGSFGSQEPGSENAPVTGAPDESGHASEPGSNLGGNSMRSFAGMSISEIIGAMQADAAGRLGGGGNMGTGGVKYTDDTRPSSTTNGVSIPVTDGSSMSGVDVARAAHSAGFRKDQLVKMVAIAKRESRWNPRAYNGNLKTGDQSYGLWQLNTLNSKKGGNMGDLFNSFLGKPQGNKNFDELFDPSTNARGAKYLSDRSGGTLNPWGGYKGVSDTHGADQYLTEAQQAVSQAQLGDPYPESPASGGSGSSRSTSTHLTSAPVYNITVSPQISFVGAPATPDLKRIAQEVTGMINDSVRTLEMRSA